MVRKEIFFTFRYDEWALATSLEIMATKLEQGDLVKWIDWTGKFRNRFEFPLADRAHIAQTGRNIRRSGLIQMLSNLGLPGHFEWCNQEPATTSCEIADIADEVAYLELISILRESAPKKEDYAQVLSDFKEIFELTYSSALSILAEELPTAVYIYNGRFLQERAAWEACKFLSIPVVFYEKFNPNWIERYYLFEQPTHSPRYRSQIMNDFGVEISKSDSKEFVRIGSDWFQDRQSGKTQKYTENQTQNLDLELSRPYYVFFHSSEDELITTDLISISWGDQISALDSLIAVCEHLGGFDLVIRMHPNLLYKSKREIGIWEDYGASVANHKSWVHYIPPESPINSYALIEKSIGVVTVGSTIGVEAAFLNKKSILLGRAFHEDMGITQNPMDAVSLEKLLVRELTHEELKDARFNSLKYASFHAIGGTSFKWVVRRRKSRRNFYSFGDFKIRKSLSVSVLTRLDVFIKKLKNAI